MVFICLALEGKGHRGDLLRKVESRQESIAGCLRYYFTIEEAVFATISEKNFEKVPFSRHDELFWMVFAEKASKPRGKKPKKHLEKEIPDKPRGMGKERFYRVKVDMFYHFGSKTPKTP